MSKKRYMKPVQPEDEKRKKEYEDNLRIRTITGSTLRDEDPDAAFSPPNMRIWEVLDHFRVTSESGLDEKEVKRRRKKSGSNIVYPYMQLSFAGSLRSQLHTSMSLLFIAVCLLVYIFEKNSIYLISASVAVSLFVINAIIEANAASALEVTKKFSTMKCVVKRGAKERVIDSRALVPGDIIILGPGSIVPADARLTESNSLRVSETPVFGNYAVSEKNALYLSVREDNSSKPNMVYAGSIVAEGKAVAVVCATDDELLIRKQRKAADGDKNHRPTLLQFAHTATSKLSLVSVIMCFFAVFIGAVKGFDITEIFILSVGTCFASLSDTVNSLAGASLTVGIKNMVDKGAALRNLNCIPDLCKIDTVMCEHSSAFPTRGMAATTAFTGMREYNIESSSKAKVQSLLTQALVCSDVKYAYDTQKNKKRQSRKLVGTKEDVAIAKAASSIGISLDEINNSYFRIASSYNYRSELERVLVLSGTQHKVILKGAPEFVLRHCKYYEQLGQLYPLDQKSKNRLLDAAYEMGEKNQKVIAFAEKPTEEDNLSHKSTAKDFVFVGFVGLYVSLGMDAASAVYKCSTAGIEAVVRTEEYYHVAVSLAKNAGIIKDETQAIRASEINSIDPGIYIADLPKYKLFVGIDDEHWRDVLYYRKEDDRNVALQVRSLTELPAMSIADITITSESEGNETLKQCADVIVRREGFDVITELLIKARMIYKRIHSTVRFGVSSFAAFCMALLMSVISGIGPVFRLPELIIGGVLVNFLILLSLAAAPEDCAILKKKSSSPYSTQLRYSDFLISMLYGIFTAGGMLLNYNIGKASGSEFQTVLIGVVMSMFFFAYSDITGTGSFFGGGYKNYFLTISMLVSGGLLAILFYLPSACAIFGYKPLSAVSVLLCLIYPTVQFLLFGFGRILFNSAKNGKKQPENDDHDDIEPDDIRYK